MTDLVVEPTVTTGPIAGSQKIYRDLEVSPDEYSRPPKSRSGGSTCPPETTSTSTTPPAPTPTRTP